VNRVNRKAETALFHAANFSRLLGSDKRDPRSGTGGRQAKMIRYASAFRRASLWVWLSAVRLRAVFFREEDKTHGQWIIYRELAA